MPARFARFVWAILVFGTTLGIASCSWNRGMMVDDGSPDISIEESRLPQDQSMKSLAHDLDHLERHIDWFGSVTAKVPDVWGQARLTQYREEYEKSMKDEINNFKYVVNGSQSRSDQQYFASATALSIASQPRPPVIGRVSSSKTLVDTGRTAYALSDDPKNGALSLTKTNSALPQSSPSPAPIKPLDIADPNTLISDPDKVIKRTDAQVSRIGFQNVSTGVIGIEPTEFLAQKQRFLNFLQQIRRENEGDDTADSPGYSLNLMRVPVSVLPGKKTGVGYGAEITLTLSPILGDDLLPTTFRNLMINDLQKQLGFPMVQILGGNKEIEKLLTPEFERFIHIITRLNDYVSDAHDLSFGEIRKNALLDYLGENQQSDDFKALANNATPEMRAYFDDLGIALKKPSPGSANVRTPSSSSLSPNSLVDAIRNAHPNSFTKYTTPSLSFANGLDNRTAFPTSQLIDIYGPEALFDIAFAAEKALKAAFDKQKYAHLPDVQAYLKEETLAARDFLRKNAHLLTAHCTERLVQAIRSQRWDEVTEIRQAFRKDVALLTGVETQPPALKFDSDKLPVHLSRTTGLAWGLIVDAALLNDRLIRDMKEIASAKGQPLAGCDHWLPYFLPDPPVECRRAFNEYVKLRWPIHVFALDPYIQEQNIADSLSTRREIQLALSIAFTNGQMNARNLTRYARRLEAEYETIALNRTHIGFSHGENTFGWRFYPRFQTPDTPSNAQALIEEQLIGGPSRNQLLRQRRLEPGIRECVAVVMMPSFVPYVNVDTVNNWFPVTNPKHKVLDHTQALKLSRTVQTIKTVGCGVKDADKYRAGESRRLMVRADQLESRLPTQTLTSAVPILDSLGGFEMFSNGTSDLAPELFGWYGAPGIDPEAESTTLFLVGDHFSPLRTHVIVGNQAVLPENQMLLSRQVMQVTFTKGAYTVGGGDAGGGEVRIHIATPYGVTRELAVPVAKVKPAPKVGFTFGTAKLTVNYGVLGTEPGKFLPIPACSGNDGDLKIAWNTPTGTLPPHVAIEFQFEYQPAGFKTPIILKVPCRGFAVGGVTAKEIVIPKQALDAIAADLIAQIAKFGPILADPNPLDKGLKSKMVTITPLVPPGIFAQGAMTADSLTVEFKAGGVCPMPVPFPPGPPQALPKPGGKQMPRILHRREQSRPTEQLPPAIAMPPVLEPSTKVKTPLGGPVDAPPDPTLPKLEPKKVDPPKKTLQEPGPSLSGLTPVSAIKDDFKMIDAKKDDVKKDVVFVASPK